MTLFYTTFQMHHFVLSDAEASEIQVQVFVIYYGQPRCGSSDISQIMCFSQRHDTHKQTADHLTDSLTPLISGGSQRLIWILHSLLPPWHRSRRRSWQTTTVEIIGYIIRIIAHHSTNLLLPFILQSIFILLGPALFAASIYMTLSRLILSLNASHLSPIRPSRLTKAFLLGDVLSFSIQGNSASLTFKKKTQKVGEGMIVAGLLVQIISFGLSRTV